MRHHLYIILLTLFASCEQSETYLIKVFDAEYDEVGVPSGYINAKGDTIIPMGRYYYCFTDTLKAFATVMTHDGRTIAIDKEENELFEVYWFDNGPDNLKEGLFRIKKDGKIGFANEIGEVIIKPEYACASAFENGMAKVALNCTIIDEGEHSSMEASEWIFIDKKGRIVDQ